MFFISLIILFAVSFGLSLLSLRAELKKTEHKKAKEVHEDLKKGRVIFYSPSSSKD